MILSFSRKFPWKAETFFKKKIKGGIKKHTFRLGFRWKLKYVIQFWDLSPRAHKAKPSPQPFEIKNEPTFPTLIQTFELEYLRDGAYVFQIRLSIDQKSVVVRWNFRDHKVETVLDEGINFDEVALNDGFDSSSDFCQYFSPKGDEMKLKIEGQIIHWSNIKY